ncbi:hypothetical protein [Yoonia sp. SS1-5]|uniref:Uncharacterized protein n=1 Tax=Yoonia rhodophyticola TaxID=3137370 RepID=A0AAN0M9R8_9RHOB
MVNISATHATSAGSGSFADRPRQPLGRPASVLRGLGLSVLVGTLGACASGADPEQSLSSKQVAPSPLIQSAFREPHQDGTFARLGITEATATEYSYETSDGLDIPT